MAFDRKCVLLVICVASLFKSSVGDCKSRLRNMVIREGAPLSLNSGDNQDCHWSIAPSDLTFNIKRNMSAGNGELDPSFRQAYSLEGSNLVMNSAETQPGVSPYATSGIYILTCPGDECTTAAKVVVVQSGPTCSCTNDKDGQSTTFTVTIVYADTAKNDMYPAFYFSLRGQIIKSDMPLPIRDDRFRFRSTSEYKRRGRSLGLLTDFGVTVNFTSPSEYPVRHIDPLAPDFSATCNFDKKCT